MTQRQWLADMHMYEELEQIPQRDFAIIDYARASDQGQVALLKWYDLRQRAMALMMPGRMGDFLQGVDSQTLVVAHTRTSARAADFYL